MDDECEKANCPNCNREITYIPNNGWTDDECHCKHWVGKYLVEYFAPNEKIPETTYVSLQGKIIYCVDKLIRIDCEQRVETMLLLK